MSTYSTEISVERLLPCIRCCYPLFDANPECPDCGGEGESWRELFIEVTGEFSQASRGARDRYGAPLEPDEDASAEVTSAIGEYGEIELTRREEEEAEEALLEAVEDQREAAIEARAEARMW